MDLVQQVARLTLMGVVLTAAQGCGQGTSVPKDEHGPAKMDLASSPATVVSARPPAPPVQIAVHRLPLLFPVDGAPVKEVRLDATNKVIDLAPGVKFAGWTFGHEIPGPTVRVRAGDRVRFKMTNRSDEAIGGLNVSPAMMHSMDFHSAMVSPQDKYRSIAPGETISFEFTANYPGVYLYHCGTPPILEHIAAGMYGMMIVEPKNGYPTKADREYAVVQSEIYAKLDPQGRKVDGVPLYVADQQAMLDKRPSHVVFNGRVNGMVEKPIIAKKGERVRLFVLNVGPNDTSSFHVVGTIFDRVYNEGNVANQFRGMQTTLLGASSGTIAELIIPEKGKYIMVDHEFADASKGAMGIIDATEEKGAPVTSQAAPGGGHDQHAQAAAPQIAAPQAPAPQAATPQAPAPQAATAQAPPGKALAPHERIEKARTLFTQRCLICHEPPAGMMRMAPPLQGVTQRRDRAWLTKWLTSPSKMLAEDPTAQELLREWKNVPMPEVNLTAQEVEWMIDFLEKEYARGGAPKGKKPVKAATAPGKPGATL